MKLYTYYRSSAAYRVRIALNLKGLAYEAATVHLLNDRAALNQAAYRAKNPLGLVPTLEDAGTALSQSMAIIEYLDEAYPQAPALLPSTPLARARVRALAQTIACDIHPVNNLRILNYLQNELGLSVAQKDAWYRHWVHEGLLAVEKLLADHPDTGTFCHGEQPGLADCCLVPQVFNARRFACPLEEMPTIARIMAACEALPAFVQAAPEQQPDAE